MSSKKYIKHSTLFLPNLPSHVKHSDLSRVFHTYRVKHIIIGDNDRKIWRSERDGFMPQYARIIFQNNVEAEKALATQHVRQIPELKPPVVLNLSVMQGSPSISSQVSAHPRKVKLLPPTYTEIQLYELLRRFGPLAYVKISENLGGIVQFWTEDDALKAEAAVKAEFAQSTKINLQAYAPCDLLCSNLAPSVDAEILKTHFGKAGSITSSRVYSARNKRGKGKGYVSFATPEEAETAIELFNGTTFESTVIVVRHREQAQPSKPCPKFTPENEAVKVPMSAGMADESVPSNQTAEAIDEQHRENIASYRAQIAALEVRVRTDQADHRAQQAELEKTINTLLQRYSEMKVQAEEKLKQEEDHQQEVHALTLRLEALEAKLRQSETSNNIAQDERDVWRRKFEVADSRRKILELESDRPLWEEAKKKREERARQESEKNKKKEEEKRAREEEVERRRKAAEEARRRFQEQEKQRAREERARKEREEAARKAREREKAEEVRKAAWRECTLAEEERCRQRDIRRPFMWGFGNWANSLALDRFLLVSDEFDKTKFSENQPLTVGNIPWPVCDDPSQFIVEDLDWGKVEEFFRYVRRVKTAPEYNSLVERVHRMFHPDKWRSRSILDSVYDEELRATLGRAGNTVAQAMTPLWRESKGY